MKKKIIAGVILSIMSALTFGACGSPSNISAEFNQKEYTHSIGEEVNFFDELSLKGIEENDIAISSTNKNILDGEKGILKAKASGQAYVLAKHGKQLLAKVKVNVKYKLSAPENISISPKGVLSWDVASVNIDGREIGADGYSVTYYRVDLPDGENAKETTIECAKNFLEMDFDDGIYAVKVQAISKNKLIDSSVASDNINWNVMGFVENVQILEQDAFGSSSAKIVWDEKENAIYDIYFDGVRIAQNLINNSQNIYYGKLNAGDTAILEIVAKDDNGSLFESVTKIKFTRLELASINLEESTLVWNPVSNAINYMIKHKEGIETIATSSYDISGCRAGLYEFEVMPLGSEGKIASEGYLNGTVCERFAIAKLETPEFSFKIVDKKLHVEISEQQYNSRYEIYVDGNKMKIVDVVKGDDKLDVVEFDISTLTVGEHALSVKAIKAGEVNIDGVTTSNVINSDEKTSTFQVLESPASIAHVLDGKNSIITVPKHDKANKYLLYINDSFVEEKDASQDAVFIYANLNDIVPEGGKYIIKIIAIQDDDGEEIAVRSQCIKEIEILDVVSEGSSKENGFYEWTPIKQDSNYYYEIYKTNKDKDVLDSEPIQAGTTESAKTQDELENGYYKIKVYSKSTNTNFYLDSNFRGQGYFEDDFIVTRQIETPNVVFLEGENQYQLQITTTQFGGKYDVYVDGILDGTAISGELPLITYTLENKFLIAKDYVISIIARGGDAYDEVIFISSQAKAINIHRLSQAEKVATIDYDNMQEDIWSPLETLTVDKVTNSIKAEAKLGQTPIINKTDYSFDISDHSKYGSDFDLSLTLKAKEDEGDDYYLDSIAKTYTFKRVQSPSSVLYNNGELQFNCDDEKIQDYYITIKIVTNGMGSHIYRFSATSNVVNLQGIINLQIEQSEEFKSAYRSMTELEVQIISRANIEQENVHYLPSSKGTNAKGEDGVLITKLDTTVVSFKKSTQTILWQSPLNATTGVVYDVYLNGNRVKTDYTQTSITLDKLTGFNEESLNEIYIRPKHSQYLEADKSNIIKIQKLAIEDNISITKDNGEYFAGLEIKSNTTAVENVYVNNGSENVTLASGRASINLGDYDGVEKFSFQLISKEIVDNIYYLDSSIVVYTLKNIDDIILSIKGDKISWNNAISLLSGEDKNPYIYKVEIACKGEIYSFEQTESEILISSLESKIGEKLEGEFVVKVYSVFKEHSYYLTSLNDALGLRGENDSNEVKAKKLAPINDMSISITRGSGANELQKIENSFVDFTFTDNWSEFSDEIFKFKISGVDSEFTIPSYPANYSIYSLQLSDGKYTLRIALSVFASSPQNINVEYWVERLGSISSEKATSQVARLNKIDSVSLSEKGILTIVDTQDAKYLLQLNINGYTKESELSFNEINGFNLLSEGWLIERFGNYEIKVLTFDESGKKLPAKDSVSVVGIKYEGIQSIELDDNGLIKLNMANEDFSDAQFFIKTFNSQGETIIKSFSPNNYDGQEYTYFITMLNAVNMFEEITVDGERTFEFTIRKLDSIDGDWKSTSFNFAYETTAPKEARDRYGNDYLLFELGDNTSITFGVEGELSYQLMGEKTTGDILNYLGATNFEGYWVVNDENDQQYFASTQPVGEGYSSTHCYAVCLNELLASYYMGQFELDVFRLEKKDDGSYTQYQSTHLSKYKLSMVDEVGEELPVQIVEGRYLKWGWTQKDELKDTSPSGYWVEITLESGNVSYFKTSTGILDLCGERVKLNQGGEYTVVVRAINDANNILASNYSTTQTLIRYQAPTSIGVIDGTIGFAQENDFIDSLKTFFGSQTSDDYAGVIFKKEFLNPFTFQANSSVVQEKILIKMTRVENGSYQETYTMAVRAIDLLLDQMITNALSDYGEVGKEYSYFALLKEYQKTKANSLDEKDINVFNFIEAILSSKRGLGSHYMPLSDVGKSLPEGEYEVSFAQQGMGQHIQSPYSTAQTIYISPAPETSIQVETFKGKEKQYTITIIPNTTFGGNLSHEYVLSIRSDGMDPIKITAKYSLGSWSLFYNNIPLSIAEISFVDSLGEEEGFKINASSMIEEVNSKLQQYGMELPYGQGIIIDIYCSGDDDNSVVNGKSAVVEIEYQEIDVSDIQLQDGKINLQLTRANGDLEMRYKYSNDIAEYVKIIEASSNTSVNLPEGRAGEIDYIILALKGGITYNRINVASESYGLFGLYKLNQPTMTTERNNIKISYAQVDLGKMTTLDYIISNNSTGVSFEGQTSNREISYSPSNEEYKANEFFASLKGNNGRFEEITNTHSDKCDHMFILEGGQTPILASGQTSLSAKMLDYNTETNGSIAIELGNVKIEKSLSEDASTASGTIIYKVDIKTYQEQKENEFVYISTQTIYTTQFDEGILSGRLIEEKRDAYKIYVTAIVGREDATGEIETLQGKKYTMAETFTFEDGCHVLPSRILELDEEQYIRRTPEAQEVDVIRGRVGFKVPESITEDNIKIIALVGNSERDIAGTYEFLESINGLKQVYFSPREDELIDITQSFTIKTFLFDEEEIISFSADRGGVYKFKQATQNEYDVGVDNLGTYIDFENYFNNTVGTDDDNVCYKLKIVEDGDEENATYLKVNTDTPDDSNFKFYPSEDASQISVKAIDRQGDEDYVVSDSNRKRVFESKSLLVSLFATTGEFDAQWNDEEARIDFNVPDEDKNYEFYYEVEVYNAPGSIKETGKTTNRYYRPMNMGSILSVKFKVREMPTENNILCLFTDMIEKTDINSSFRLFAGGNGTQAEPYLIQNENQFKNIVLRNEKDIYFKLIDDIELKNLHLDTLNAVINGDGRTLTITSSLLFDANYTIKNVAGFEQDAQITSYYSLFESISPFGMMDNLKIKFNFTCNEKDKTAIVAPIAFRNRGQISNLEISAFGIESASRIILGGAVGINSGEIFKVTNQANITIITDVDVAYGAISAFNISEQYNGKQIKGTIFGCFNKKKITIDAEGKVVQVAGITLKNMGDVIACGNDGDVEVRDAMSTYRAGIVLSNIGGGISYAFNNGAFSPVTNNNYSAGVIYNSEIGTFSYLADSSLIVVENSTKDNYKNIYQNVSGGAINSTELSINTFSEMYETKWGEITVEFVIIKDTTYKILINLK